MRIAGFMLGAVLSCGSALPAVAADALFDESTFRSMVADQRARRVGDMITVVVFETSSATASADTALQRNNSVGLQAQTNDRRHGLSLGANNQFDGGGTVQRSGRVLAQLNVNVTGVLDNGDLLIRGEQEIELNADHQHIRLEGRVRAVDLSAANTVQSNRIADLRLSLVGTGQLAQRQEPGFWSKVLTWLGF